MKRKVFFSFLGTGPYLTCNYNFGDKLIPEIRYIQEASIKAHCLDFDKFLFFNTIDASRKNWLDKGQELNDIAYSPDPRGLKSRLDSITEIKGKFEEILIPEGFSEEEIWKIFQTVYDKIENNDEIVLDITHAFRSIPMLGMALLNYLKVVKNISISGIYYGAFEALGKPAEVLKKPISDRNANVINLLSFSVLQDWAFAAHNLTNFGNPKRLVDLARNEYKPILKETKGQDNEAKSLRNIMEKIEDIFKNIRYSRGVAIFESATVKDICKKIELIKNNKSFITPLNPLLEELFRKVSKLKENEIKNGFEVVQWCIDFGWIPQGYTFLKETLISYIIELEKIQIKKIIQEKGSQKSLLLPDKIWLSKELRDIASSVFTLKKGEIEEEKWSGSAGSYPEITRYLLACKSMDDFSNIGLNLELRNDINHCGARCNPADTAHLEKKLSDCYSLTLEVIKNNE